MITRLYKLNRRGITLTEVLIGIMVLGIGVISLATLFPIGLLRLKRAVNDVRGTMTAESGWNEVRVRNLFAAPLGPWYFYNPSPVPTPAPVVYVYSPFSADEDSITMLGAANFTAGNPPFRPVTGTGIPVVIDPLWLLQNGDPNPSTTPMLTRFGLADLDTSGTIDFLGAQGLVRTRAGIATMSLASEIFASHDELAFGDVENRRMIPLQEVVGTAPPYLSPTYGVPFNGNSLYRERRYTWMVIARKVSAIQIYSPGPDGVVGDTSTTPSSLLAGIDDILDNVGPDMKANYPPGPPPPGPPTVPGTFVSTDDPASDMATAAPVLAPAGPFEVTIVVFYNRDFTSREITYTNDVYPVAKTSPDPSTTRPVPIFSPVPRKVTISGIDYFYGPAEATLVQRSDGIPFPEIPVGSYIMDSTFDGSVRVDSSGKLIMGPRSGYVYRVVGKSLNAAGNILILSLDQPARPNGQIPVPITTGPNPEPPYTLPLAKPDANGDIKDPGGYVLTVLKGAVAVFEKQTP